MLVPTFENQDYLEHTLLQLHHRGLRRVVVLDGGSEDPIMKSYLDDLSGRDVCIIRLSDNPGPRWCWEDREFYSALPEMFCLTDPDLLFNPELPSDFLDVFLALTEEFALGKAGFALTLNDDLDESEFFWGRRFQTVRSWEAKYWATPLRSTNNVEAYLADIDTTFALYNKRFFDPSSPLSAVRVAGPYEATHIPWYPKIRRNFRVPNVRGRHSSWASGNEIAMMREALGALEAELFALKTSQSWRATAPIRSLGDAFRLWVSRLEDNSRFKKGKSR